MKSRPYLIQLLCLLKPACKGLFPSKHYTALERQSDPTIWAVHIIFIYLTRNENGTRAVMCSTVVSWIARRSASIGQ